MWLLGKPVPLNLGWAHAGNVGDTLGWFSFRVSPCLDTRPRARG